MIAFSSIGHDPDRSPGPEFIATATGRGTPAFPRRALFLRDASRSWANHPGFAPALLQAVERVRARAPVARIATVGLSMGAFSALVAARLMPVDAVIAFSPQWSVLPDQGETRWRRWTDALPPVRWPEAPLPDHGRAWLFHGAADDLAQATGFPPHPRVDQLFFPGLGHSGLVPHLKARGVLARVVETAMAGDRRALLRIAASAGGIRRARFPLSTPL